MGVVGGPCSQSSGKTCGVQNNIRQQNTINNVQRRWETYWNPTCKKKLLDACSTGITTHKRHWRNHPCHQGAHGPQECVLTLFQVTTWIASRNVCEHWVPKPQGIPSFHQQNPQDIQHTHYLHTSPQKLEANTRRGRKLRLLRYKLNLGIHIGGHLERTNNPRLHWQKNKFSQCWRRRYQNQHKTQARVQRGTNPPSNIGNHYL